MGRRVRKLKKVFDFIRESMNRIYLYHRSYLNIQRPLSPVRKEKEIRCIVSVLSMAKSNLVVQEG